MATKIYTKTGDDGTTGLFGGERVPKYHLRIEAYGTVDELNSLLGVVLALGRSDVNQSNDALPSDMSATLTDISALLFTAGADLATPLDPPPVYPIPRIEAHHTEFLERCIDLYEQELEPLKAFILPTGTSAAAYLHLARTVCRRAERLVVHLAREDNIGGEVLKFLNRLSDYCFTAARLSNKRAGVPDVAWKNPALTVHSLSNPSKLADTN
jgi:cob(I)alamin adenosyltransferase